MKINRVRKGRGEENFRNFYERITFRGQLKKRKENLIGENFCEERNLNKEMTQVC